MAQVRIVQPKQSDGPLSPFGMVVELDGQPIADVRSVSVKADVDSIVTVSVEAFVSKRLDIELPSAHVDLTFIGVPGTIVEEETLPNGSRRLSVRQAS